MTQWMTVFGILFGFHFATAQVNPGDVSLESVKFSGDGCPAGTVQAVLAPDASALTLMYDQFEARVDGNNHLQKKKCEVVIKIKKPKLVSFAIMSADFRGFVFLERGARAAQEVKIQTGSGDFAKLNLNLGSQSWLGPINQNFTLSAVKPLEGMKYLSCFQPKKEAKVTIKSVIGAENGHDNAEGVITVDSFDSRLVQKYNLKWIDCLRAGIGILERL